MNYKENTGITMSVNHIWLSQFVSQTSLSVFNREKSNLVHIFITKDIQEILFMYIGQFNLELFTIELRHFSVEICLHICVFSETFLSDHASLKEFQSYLPFKFDLKTFLFTLRT